jgi:hypothetical protein
MELKLGQILYKYSDYYMMEYEVLEYKVFGFIKKEDEVHWKVKCLTCNKYDKVLIKLDDDKRLKYISMFNNKMAEEAPQYDRHKTKDKDFYHLTKKEALIEVLEKRIFYCKKAIEDNKKSILRYEEKLKSIND